MSFGSPAEVQNARNAALEDFKRVAERDHVISIVSPLISIYTALMDNCAQLAQANATLDRIASALEGLERK